MTLWKWSRTAATNATADSTCPFPEGMNPGALNDGTRGMMAAAAKYRDDISGAILTGGTSTAYTVASYQGYDTLAHLDGAMIAFTPHATNGATVTLSVDGLPAKPLRGNPGAELPGNALILGTPYVVTYNNTDGAFYLKGGLNNPYGVPVGGMIEWTGGAPPNSIFALPYGQTLSRTVFSTLWTIAQAEIAAGSLLYNNGDGSLTFGILDGRGRVSAMPDNMGGVSAGRLSAAMVSTTNGATGGTPNYQLNTGNLPPYTPTGIVPISDPGHAHFYAKGTGSTAGPGGAGALYQSDTTGTTQSSGTGITATFTGIPQGGSSAAFNLVQPTIIIPKILRIL